MCKGLHLVEARHAAVDDDLATVYLAWSGYAYGRSGYGVPAPEAMRRRFSLIDVAVKNQDNREHDIFDSDDYLQEHGGMVASKDRRMTTHHVEQHWLPRFLIVSNMEIDDPSAIVDGNERVVRPRLADARFFWEQDLKVPLETQAGKLDRIIFHDRLGSVADKVERVARLAGWDRRDVYALGVTLYEMLAAVRPYDAKSYPELVLQIAAGRARPLHEGGRQRPRPARAHMGNRPDRRDRD